MRKSSLPPESLQDGSELKNLTEAVSYVATPTEKRLKAEFWTLAANNPMLDPQSITLDVVRKVVGRTISPNQWSKPGFRDWFLNREEHRQKLEYLFGLALEAAEEILTNTDPKAQSARVNMIKVVGQLAGKVNGQGVGQIAGGGASNMIEAVGSMDKASLELLLQKNGINVQVRAEKQNIIDVSADDKND